MANTSNDDELALKLEALREAARRANWDALHGPPHLRTGRFRPEDLLRERERERIHGNGPEPKEHPTDTSSRDDESR